MKKLLYLALTCALAVFAVSCQKDDAQITNTVTLNGKVYNADLDAAVRRIDGGLLEMDGDIHILDDDGPNMYFPAGVLGKHNLPSDKFTLGIAKQEFKSGTVNIYLDSKNHVCLILDAVLFTGEKIKISVRTSYEVNVSD